jgi:NADH-quinone oxidoreductase subunit N
MTIGNLLALRQHDLKRLLAFSGIAQIGYVLAALAAGTTLAAGLALFYFVAYLVSNAGRSSRSPRWRRRASSRRSTVRAT